MHLSTEGRRTFLANIGGRIMNLSLKASISKSGLQIDILVNITSRSNRFRIYWSLVAHDEQERWIVL